MFVCMCEYVYMHHTSGDDNTPISSSHAIFLRIVLRQIIIRFLNVKPFRFIQPSSISLVYFFSPRHSSRAIQKLLFWLVNCILIRIVVRG